MLHPVIMYCDDAEVWKQVFQEGKWVGVFQFTNIGAQKFCQQVKPTNLVDLAAITSIYRPGPLSANVHNQYVRAIHDPDSIKYDHPLMKEVLEETYGFIIFQEQLALIAHKMGKDVSLDEGNMLRKLLTKKGTGKGAKDLEKIKRKFVAGCEEKGLTVHQADDIWQQMEFFSGYGFNASHAISYATLSYQCAWLLTHFPAEWTAAFLDKEPEQRKEAAISVAKSIGFNIESLNINTSGRVWEISENGQTLIQPLTSIKGLGSAAIDQIMNNRPFHEIEDFLFNENITYSKLNKKALDVLIRSETLDPLMDERFKGRRHFWFSVAVERPRKLKNLEEQVETQGKFLEEEGGVDFSTEDRINNLVNLTGMYPMHLAMKDETAIRLREKYIPPISEYDPELSPVVWFIPRKIIPRKTKNNKDYWIVEVTDENNVLTTIKCWGIKDTDVLQRDKPYMASLEHNDQWGFSTRSIRHNFRLLG